MLYIKQGFPNKHNNIYIDSIKRKIEPKSSQFSQRRLKTSPERPFLSPTMDKILRKYQTLNIRQSEKQPMECRFPPLKDSPVREDERKRWSQIEKEEYNLVKQQITVGKSKSTCIQNKRSLQFNSSSKHHASSLIDTGIIKQSHPLRERVLARESWMDHIRNLNKSRRQSFLKNNSGYLFPEVVSKLPKINTFQQEENLILAKSMDLKISEQQDIFCSRQSKRSQMKMRAHKLGGLAVNRKRMRTISYESTDSQITPWKQAQGGTKFLF